MSPADLRVGDAVWFGVGGVWVRARILRFAKPRAPSKTPIAVVLIDPVATRARYARAPIDEVLPLHALAPLGDGTTPDVPDARAWWIACG